MADIMRKVQTKNGENFSRLLFEEENLRVQIQKYQDVYTTKPFNSQGITWHK